MDENFKKLVDFRSGSDYPEWARDGITCRTTVVLSFVDRIKVLLFGRVEVDTFTATENLPGRLETRSHARVITPRLPRRQIAYVAENKDVQ